MDREAGIEHVEHVSIDPTAARSVHDDTPESPRRLGPLGIVLGALGIAAILATAIIGALYGPVGP
jgi:hypothetical protein